MRCANREMTDIEMCTLCTTSLAPSIFEVEKNNSLISFSFYQMHTTNLQFTSVQQGLVVWFKIYTYT